MVFLQNTVQSTRYLYAGDNDRLIKLKQDKASYEKDYPGHSLKVERRGFSEKMGQFFFSFLWWISPIWLAWYACCKVKMRD